MKSSMLFMLPVLFLVQKVDFTDPSNVLKAQLGFGTVQSLILLLCAYIYLQIKKSNNQTQITVPPTPSPFGGATGAPQQMTITEYDLAQLRKFAQQVVIGICIAVFLFVKWDIVPPLAIQCVLNPVNLYGNPLFKLYVLGASQASYPRPFPEENPLAGLIPTPAAEPENTSDNQIQPDTSKDAKKSKKQN